MIFAFGAQRSGTWWLQRMLTAHPEVSAVPSETYLFSEGIRPLFERFHHGVRSSTTVGQLHVERDVLLDATRGFCDSVFAPHLAPGSRYLSERSPGHARAVDLLAQVYPDARLVHIIRDGRDVARSLAAREWGPESVGAAARRWREVVEAARAGAPADNYLEVRYEELIEDLQSGVRDLYEWLGLPAGTDVLAEALREGRRPLNEDPKDPRVSVGKWRDHFTDEDLAAFEAEAGELAAELGYADGARPAPRAANAAPVAPASHLSLGARLRRRARTAPIAATRRPAVNQEVGGALGTAARVADDLLGALQTARPDRLRALLADDASLRVLAPGGETTVAGADQVVAALAGDLAFRGRQLRGESHPGIPHYTLVLVYELSAGAREARIVILDIKGPRVEAVTVHRMPWATS